MSLWLWLLFIASLVGLLAVDVGLTRHKNAKVSASEGLLSTFIWIAVAVGVGIAISIAYQEKHLDLEDALSHVGSFKHPTSAANAALQFVAAYVVEIALSLDNVAVLSLLFLHFGVREADRQKVLFWAILGCLVARAILISVFAQALHLAWMNYLFGVLIAIAMLRTLFLPDESTDFDRKYLIRIIRHLPWKSRPAADTSTPFIPATPANSKAPNASKALPLAAIALAAAAADISFATDSIPAVFAVTQDPLIAVSSNLLALLALRSLFFAMQNAISRFRYLKLSVVLILLCLSVKTFLVASSPDTAFKPLATAITLGAVVLIVTTAIIASRLRTRRLAARAGPAESTEPRPLPIDDLIETTLAARRNLRKIGILIAGTLICIVGILIAPLPGPGPIIIVPIGLALLATEFLWAKRLLDRFKYLQTQADNLSTKTPLWLVPVVIVAFWILAIILAQVVSHRPWVVHLVSKPIPPWQIYTPAAGLFIPVAYWAFKAVRANRKPPTPPPPAPPL